MQTLVPVILVILFAWTLGISIVLYRIFILFNKLTKGVDETDLKKILEKVIDRAEVNETGIRELIKRATLLEDEGRFHIQKLGLVRFNPFKELGGDHSFSLAILDNRETGVVLTSLHTRDRTRVYMKEIKKGKSEFELSSEENKALGVAEKMKQ